MAAEDWATHAPSARVKNGERSQLAADVQAFLASGGKVYYAGKGESSEVKPAADSSLDAGRENAKKKARANKGTVTDKQRKIMSALREAMKGGNTVSFEDALKAVKIRPDSLRTLLNSICRHGYFDFDGETITARVAK